MRGHMYAFGQPRSSRIGLSNGTGRPAEIFRYAAAFDRLAGTALGPEESSALIDEAVASVDR